MTARDEIDPLNFSVIRIRCFFDQMKLGDATGFFYSGTVDGQPAIWLVTNWHVFSGRNAVDPTKTLDPNGAVPNRIELNVLLKLDQPEHQIGPPSDFLFQLCQFHIYDNNLQALWYQHLAKNDVDIAVLNLSSLLPRYDIRGIDSIAVSHDMKIEIGNRVFILGYPLGFSHFIDTPIWKSGIIASEPHLETDKSGGKIVVDASTRSGMSGAPVIMREKTHYLTEDERIAAFPNATRFIGVYSSRPNIKTSSSVEEDRRAEIGYVFKSGSVEQVIKEGIRGPHFGELP